MALTGTLQDFGIADILQLIGQQAKSGVLHLRGKDEEVHVLISDGCVVSADCASRRQRDRLGSLLVRADLLRPEDLERALEVQRRTLQRLGDILVELGLVTREVLQETTALQTAETIYRLFGWRSGTYAFEPGAVEWDRGSVTPLRAEAVLMEGFRQVDEWPMLRRRISSPGMTFLRPAPGAAEAGSLGASERRVLALVEPGRTVERIVDLSRLGEFETCKALLTLVNLGHLEAVPPARRALPGGVGAYARGWRDRLRLGAAGLAATAALAVPLAGAGWVAVERGAARPAGAVRVPLAAEARRLLARARAARLAAALEVWRLERGEYPPSLEAVAQAGLAEADPALAPGIDGWLYRRTPSGYVLLPPLP